MTTRDSAPRASRRARDLPGYRPRGDPSLRDVEPPPPTIDGLLERLLEAHGRIARKPAVLVSVTAPVEDRDPIELFAVARELGHEPVLWLRPSDRLALVGIGDAWSTRPTGPERFAEAARAWQNLTASAPATDRTDPTPGVGPILLGGFPFSAHPRPTSGRGSSVWAGFETARLTLPRLLVTRTQRRTWLTASAVMMAATPSPEATAAELTDLWCSLDGKPRSPIVADPSAILEMSPRTTHDTWLATVARLAGAVGRGRVDKVVLARQVDVATAVDIDVPSVLRRLEVNAPESTVFAMTRGPRTFLGATPERLARTEGRHFRTVAMAGSAARGHDANEDARLAAALLGSDKEREEHRVVVEAIRDALGPMAARLVIDRAPSVVQFRQVQHLVSEVHGDLRDRLGILSLVERLHPTPAVGGAPRDLALELIEELEGLDRGWYAGPIGWLDRNGDGEFVVGIRSGLVEGSTAHLFAGCGIVADSDPEAEWQESQIKLQVLASALGVFR